MKNKRSTECAVLMGLGAWHGCASGSKLAFQLDFRPQIHRVRIFCGGQCFYMLWWNISASGARRVWGMQSCPSHFPRAVLGHSVGNRGLIYRQKAVVCRRDKGKRSTLLGGERCLFSFVSHHWQRPWLDVYKVKRPRPPKTEDRAPVPKSSHRVKGALPTGPECIFLSYLSFEANPCPVW